jgi:APA family basic amino acid/polyamine antiporter
VIQAGTVATLATGFSAGLAELIPLGASEQVALAVVLVLATSLLNYYGVRHGARANNVTSVLKIGALVLFVAIGFSTGRGDVAQLAGRAAGSDAITLSAFGLALSPVLFSYLGWNASVYVASEIRDPARNVPRSLFVGLAFVIVIYLAVNALYLYAVPLPALRQTANAGEATAAALFGPISGTLVAVLVLTSILGTLNATILTTPRIAYAMALDGLFFRGVDQVHATHRTPAMAIAVLALASLALVVLLRSFPSVLDYTTFAIVIATIADTVALYAPARTASTAAVSRLGLPAGAGALHRGQPCDCSQHAGAAAARVRDRARDPRPGSAVLLVVHAQRQSGADVKRVPPWRIPRTAVRARPANETPARAQAVPQSGGT